MLAGIFATINATLRAKTKEALKESMLRAERGLDTADADYNRRNSRVLAVVAADAGLKAAIGLLREVPYGSKPGPQVLQNGLRSGSSRLPAGWNTDLVLLTDAEDRSPIAGFAGKGAQYAKDDAVNAQAVDRSLFPLIRFQEKYYAATEVPINLGVENIGSLILAKEIDIAPVGGSGYAVLVHDHKILLTNLSHSAAEDAESQLRARCPQSDQDCERSAWAAKNYLAVRVQGNKVRPERFQLYSLQSIDAAMNEFIVGFKRDLLLIGSGGVLVLLLFSAFGSNSLSRPLTKLIEHLNLSERTGRLRTDFPADSPVKEVNRLAQALNNAAGHLETTTLEFVETMAQALDARDPYTAGHSNRVSVNSTAIAEVMGLTAEEVRIIRIGAKLHDIGKIGVPDAVLQKPGRLTREEYDIIKLHPQIGKRILEKSGQFSEYLPIVELHHEDYNGGGYPYGLKGDEVPLGVRIVHVADVYDAITSHRAYRQAMSEEQWTAIMMEGSGKMFRSRGFGGFLYCLAAARKLWRRCWTKHCL